MLRSPSSLARSGGKWPSVYTDNNHMLLIVYVDDMKLSGPKEFMDETWERFGKGIKLEVPKGDTDENTHTFLGCVHTRKDRNNCQRCYSDSTLHGI